MAKKDKKKVMMWQGITHQDFLNDSSDSVEMSEYNLEKMKIFSANINFARQLPKLMDGLKTVDRRVIYTMYLMGAKHDRTKFVKSSTIIGDTLSKFHAHGESGPYGALVGLTQDWKKQLPLIYGDCNFGTSIDPKGFASMRYTEALLTQYSDECFFEDFDPDCVETVPSNIMGVDEPLELPSKFPNILINGGMGIAVGNKFVIPPYNVMDVYNLTKRLMNNPNTKDIYIYPDVPTGCDIINDERELKEICETGSGKLKMRARIDIEERKNTWALIIRSVPWMKSLKTILTEKLVELAKNDVVPIKDIKDYSERYTDEYGVSKMDINCEIIIPKSYDPYVVRNTIYKNTELQNTESVQFKIVTDLMVEKFNMRDLVLAWINGRREYKRRLYNKQIIKVTTRLNLLEILIELSDNKNFESVTKIIRSSDSKSAINELIRKYGMNSFQAKQIYEMRLSAFTTDAQAKYIEERKKLIKESERLMKIIKDPKEIDLIILAELEDLKKYAKPKLCRIISSKDEKEIMDTDHTLLITEMKNVKKLPYNPNKGYGSFAQGDYPTRKLKINNLESVIIVDSQGKYSVIPVSDIPNTDYNSTGNKLFSVAKLDGNAIFMERYIDEEFKGFIENVIDDELYIITVSRDGYLKKTNIKNVNLTASKGKRIAQLYDGDSLVYTGLVLGKSNVLVYTKKGDFTYIPLSIISEMTTNGKGVSVLSLKKDAVVGLSVIPNKLKGYLLIVTKRGYAKKIELEYLGETKKRKSSSYLAKISDNDEIMFIDTITDKDEIVITNKTTIYNYKPEDVATLSRMAQPKKLVPVAQGDNIISVGIVKR